MENKNYMNELNNYKQSVKKLKEDFESFKKKHIETQKPCQIGDIVEIKRSNSSLVCGKVLSFGILEDGNVYVTGLEICKSKKIYISKPYQSITILNLC